MITVLDIHGNQSQVDVNDLDYGGSIYGVATRTGADGVMEILVQPQFSDWDFPGGKIEKGEDHLDALRREYKEETGMDIEPIAPIHVATTFFQHPNPRKSPIHDIMLYYSVKIIGGEISDAGHTDSEKQYSRIAEWKPISWMGDNIRKSCNMNVRRQVLSIISSAQNNG